MTLDDELLEVFREEVGVQLEEMSAILAGAPAGWDLPRSFHLAHNVKGAGRMIGAGAFSRVAHALEDLFAEARASGRVARPLAALAREGAALGHACFEQLGAEVEPDVRGYVDRVAAALRRRAGGRTRSESDASPGPVASSETLRSTIPSSETLHAHLEASPIASTHLAHTDESAAAEPLREIEPRAGASTVRVAVDKLQVLMGLGAELMTGAERSEARRVLAKRLVRDLRDMRRGHPSVARHEGLARALASAAELLSALERDHVRSQQLADRLQDGIRRLRMVRVDTLRLALGRAVQSAALAAGRSAELRIEGGDTEVDRAILERLRDPLMHLVRNAVAHGIEDARARAAAGKPAQGTIVLIARGEGSWVELVVQDDGRGVDLDAVRAKALREGLVSHAAGADELFDLLFRAGFSTAATVSELAGRGFGMDIVRTRLEEMGGSVSIGSEAGRGTRVRMRAPLTLLTTRVLVISAAGQTFALPMIGVELALWVDSARVRTIEAGEVVEVGDGLVPVVALTALLGLGVMEARDRSPAVVVRSGHRRRALMVDEVLGEREVTMQALPWNLAHVPGVAGAALTESEEVLIVLHVHDLASARPGGSIARATTERASAVRQRRVLVADDSVTSRTLVRNILSSAGYEVVVAVHGEAAFGLLGELDVDLVVTDVDMPKMSGIELTRRIRATPLLERLPVILVTSLGSDEDRRRGADAGADAYIVKGAFDQDELLRAVARLIG